MLKLSNIVQPNPGYIGECEVIRNRWVAPLIPVYQRTKRSIIHPCYNPNDGQGPAPGRTFSYAMRGTITLNHILKIV